MKCYIIQDHKLSQSWGMLPKSSPDKVLIRVNAIGINRADLLQVQGKYPSPDGSDIPGLEVSGIRVDTGERVAALLTSGGYAEYVAVPESQLISIPDSMSFEEAAALPEALAVAWLNLYSLGDINGKDIHNDKILIHGGSSGVGHMLVKFALYEGFTVYTTSRSIRKLSHFYNHCHTISFEEEFDEYINYHGKVSLIIDILGGKYLDTNIRCCDYGAKIVMLASMSGRAGEIDLGELLKRNVSIIGSTLRSKDLDVKSSIMSNVRNHLLPKVVNGSVTPIISGVYDFSEMKEAHRYMQENDNVGKIIVKIPT